MVVYDIAALLSRFDWRDDTTLAGMLASLLGESLLLDALIIPSRTGVTTSSCLMAARIGMILSSCITIPRGSQGHGIWTSGCCWTESNSPQWNARAGLEVGGFPTMVRASPNMRSRGGASC